MKTFVHMCMILIIGLLLSFQANVDAIPQCNVGVVCRGSNELCWGSECRCEEGYTRIGSKCVLMSVEIPELGKAYGERCFINPLEDECTGISRMFCDPEEYRCRCQDGYNYDGSYCTSTTTTYGQWGNWQDISCSVTCGSGVSTQQRTRSCLSGSCSQDLRETRQRSCSRTSCTTTYGQWGNWQDISCSVTCGSGVSTQRRTRSCLSGSCSQDLRETRQRSCSRTSCKLDYGSVCTGDQCLSILSCITGKCLCAEGSYYTADSCNTSTALRPTISSTVAPSTSSVRVTWNSPPASGYINSFVIKYTEVGSTLVQTSPVSGDVSSHLVTGLKAGTSYTFVVVRSITRYGRKQKVVDSLSVGGTSEKINYGETCVSNGTCKNLRTDCFSSICRCNHGYFWKDTTCLPNANLSSRKVDTETLFTTQLRVTWTPSAYPDIVTGYLVELSPPISSENIVISGTSATISSLTPGERYSITVSSRSSYLNRGETIAAGAVLGTTKPAPTSGLAPATSLTEPTAQIFFYKADGRAVSYTVTLTGNEYNIERSASGSQDILSASFPGVAAGLFYNLTVITNSYGVSSDPFKSMIRIRAEASEAVVGLSAYDVSSRATSLSWKRPINTKGALFKYTIEVYNSSTCVQRINIQCSECLQSMNVTESFEISCEKENNAIISQSDLNNVNFLVRYSLSLLPATAYDVVIAAYNEEGKGRTDQEIVITEQEVPRNPRQVRYTSKTSESVELRWTPPEPRPGVTTYIITVYEWDEERNEYISFRNISSMGFFNVSMNITGLSSYWKYRFEMYAKTSKGVSNTVDGPEVITDESAPTAVENLEHQPVDEMYNQYQLSWRCPAQKDGRNGIVKRATVITSSFTKVINVIPKMGEHHFDNADCTWREHITVTPEFNYTFEVYISNSQKGESTSFQRYMPAGPPSIRNPERPIIDVVRGTETDESVELLTCPTCLLDNSNGVIVKSGILVCAKGECPTRNVKEVKTAEDYDVSPNWDTSSSGSFKTWYRATGDDWLKGKEASDEIRFVLGEESCGVQDQSRFCNGHLPVDRTYRVWPFACTRVACSEGRYVEFTLVVKDKSLPLPIIGAIVGGAVLVVLAAVLLVLYIKVFRPRSQRQRCTKYVSDTSPKDDTYAEIGGGLGVVQDGQPDLDFNNTKDSQPCSENTYDQLKVYSNQGQHDYGKIKVK